MASLIGKARKPKFDLHLKIYDLNNVPLASGHSYIKWHLAHSMHAEHRGRTAKRPIANHKVDYGFSKLVSAIRVSIDKANNLTECPLELEVLQEFAAADKITLGYVRLNLSEYVEESDALTRDTASPPPRIRYGSPGTSPPSAAPPPDEPAAQDGIVRRYLMEDSKVNCTLKIGILMVQVDGERSFSAPPLRTAPVFGGIAGLVAPEQVEVETGPLPSISTGRDVSEVHDLYRRTLAASWLRQPGELTADECIEDIFSGGNGWKTKRDANSAPDTDDDDDDDAASNNNNNNNDTLRPNDFRRLAAQHQHRHRAHSASSDRSTSTVTGRGGNSHRRAVRIALDDPRDDDDAAAAAGRNLARTLGGGSSSSDGDRRGGHAPPRRAREVTESEVREDLVAWKLPSVAT